MIRSLGNIAGSGRLIAGIGIAHISLTGRLGIAVPLGISPLTRIPLHSLGIILLRIRILISSLIGHCRRLAVGIARLLVSALTANNRLAARNLRRLIHALGRLIAGLLGLIAGLLGLIARLLGLIAGLLRLISLLLGLLIALEGPPPWITARRVIRLDAVTLPLSIIVIVLIHGFFPFCRVPTSGNPTA